MMADLLAGKEIQSPAPRRDEAVRSLRLLYAGANLAEGSFNRDHSQARGRETKNRKYRWENMQSRRGSAAIDAVQWVKFLKVGRIFLSRIGTSL